MFPPPENLPNPGIKPRISYVYCLSGGFSTTESPGKLIEMYLKLIKLI